MKRKLDFVTNSSTTSFIGWGVYLSDEEFEKNETLINKAFENYKSSKYVDPDMTIEKFKEEKYNIIENLGSKLIEFSFGYDSSGDLMIAGSPNKMKDDQTLGEFKKQIINELKELGIIVETLTWIEEAWRDG